MPLKTPTFWYRAPSAPAPLQEKMLGLLSPLYQLGRTITGHKNGYKSSVPVLCVGNAVAGGSGKTPTAIALSALIRKYQIKHNPAFLTRGYKGAIKHPTLVDLEAHDFQAAGDESLLLARKCATIVSPDRAAGAQLAEDDNFDLIIMDDGLQNASLLKDISFMVIDGMAGFGNLKTLPAGPLREDLNSAFARTDAFILIGSDQRHILDILPTNKPLFKAVIEADTNNLPDKNQPLLAFSGLGQPDKFYRLLVDLGYQVKSWHAFSDHHAYSAAELEHMAGIAQREQLTMVTTEKDHVRLKGSSFETRVKTLPIQLTFEDEPILATYIQERLT